MGAVLEHNQTSKPEKKERTFKVTQVNGSEIFRATKTNVVAEQLKYSKRDLNMMWPSKNQIGPLMSVNQNPTAKERSTSLTGF